MVYIYILLVEPLAHFGIQSSRRYGKFATAAVASNGMEKDWDIKFAIVFRYLTTVFFSGVLLIDSSMYHVVSS